MYLKQLLKEAGRLFRPSKQMRVSSRRFPTLNAPAGCWIKEVDTFSAPCIVGHAREVTRTPWHAAMEVNASPAIQL